MNAPAESPQLNLTAETLQQDNRAADRGLKTSYCQLTLTQAAEIVARDLTSATFYQQRAKDNFYLKQYDQALLDYLQAIYYGSLDMYTYLGSYALLKILQFPGKNDFDLQKAEVLYNVKSKQGIHWTPTNLALKKSLIDVALILSSQGKYQELLSVCHTLLNLAPYDVIIYSYQLAAHLYLHEYEAALLDCLVLRIINKTQDNAFQHIEASLIELMQHQYKLQHPQPSEALTSFLNLPKPLASQYLNRTENTSKSKPSKDEKPAIYPQKLPSGIHKKQISSSHTRNVFFPQSPKKCTYKKLAVSSTALHNKP